MSFTCIPVQIEPNESPLRKRLFSFERSATFPPQADPVLVDLFSSVVARGALWVDYPPHSPRYMYMYMCSDYLIARTRVPNSTKDGVL